MQGSLLHGMQHQRRKACDKDADMSCRVPGQDDQHRNMRHDQLAMLKPRVVLVTDDIVSLQVPNAREHIAGRWLSDSCQVQIYFVGLIKNTQ